MNPSALEQAEQFLAQSGEFRLGDLVTESAHPHTLHLSQTAEKSVEAALGSLFEVDIDVIAAYRAWVDTGAPERISGAVIDSLMAGGRLFFTGCGATGRLSILLESIWREFWQAGGYAGPEWAQRAHSVMAGGDYALIKSVEGFEDFAQFGAKQIGDLGVSDQDVVFAITEGGETSFVIGTAWEGLKAGAKVYFVYCNPDDVLRERVTRSREIIDEPRIEKINLTSGPMAVMGSTRMQATSIQLCAMLTILETVVRRLTSPGSTQSIAREVAGSFLAMLEQMHSTLCSQDVLSSLAEAVSLEENAYRHLGKSTYFADHLGIDVLTDTTERSPTFCTPAFRKWDDGTASDSWTYLILPYADAEGAWTNLLKRPPYGLQWTDAEIASLAGPEKADRQSAIMRQIGPSEILRFRIGLDGLVHRPVNAGDHIVCVAVQSEMERIISTDGFYRTQIEQAHRHGASAALVFLGDAESVAEVRHSVRSWDVPCSLVVITIPDNGLLLDGITRVAAKMLLNTLSTCVMVRLGRVQGNCMVAVVPSNLKLIDRSVRYVQLLTGLSYEDACRRLFESIEYTKPRMQAGQAYPPPVELTVTRATRGCTLDQAESYIRH